MELLFSKWLVLLSVEYGTADSAGSHCTDWSGLLTQQ